MGQKLAQIVRRVRSVETRNPFTDSFDTQRRTIALRLMIEFVSTNASSNIHRSVYPEWCRTGSHLVIRSYM